MFSGDEECAYELSNLKDKKYGKNINKMLDPTFHTNSLHFELISQRTGNTTVITLLWFQ